MLQPFVENRLDPSADSRSIVCGIIGDHPSEYAKSPSIWTAAFKDLEADAIYLPFDVTEQNLAGLVNALRDCPAYIGGNVTVPYKVAVMAHLDEVDAVAARIGAVNTIVKSDDGRLVGYNTDADGAIGSLLQPTPWAPEPFLPSLDGLDVVMIGAGGAARATAFALAARVGSGRIAIANRSAERAAELASAVDAAHGNARAVAVEALADAVRGADLIINASVVGQSGIRRMSGDRLTCVEPYSPLASADPAVLAASANDTDAAFDGAWFQASATDIGANQQAASRIVNEAKPDAAFFDLVYSPLETAFLRQARLSGHATLNGKGMNIIQAVEAFVPRVMGPHLEAQGWSPDEAYKRVFESMLAVW